MAKGHPCHLFVRR